MGSREKSPSAGQSLGVVPGCRAGFLGWDEMWFVAGVLSLDPAHGPACHAVADRAHLSLGEIAPVLEGAVSLAGNFIAHPVRYAGQATARRPRSPGNSQPIRPASSCEASTCQLMTDRALEGACADKDRRLRAETAGVSGRHGRSEPGVAASSALM